MTRSEPRLPLPLSPEKEARYSEFRFRTLLHLEHMCKLLPFQPLFRFPQESFDFRCICISVFTLLRLSLPQVSVCCRIWSSWIGLKRKCLFPFSRQCEMSRNFLYFDEKTFLFLSIFAKMQSVVYFNNFANLVFAKNYIRSKKSVSRNHFTLCFMKKKPRK